MSGGLEACSSRNRVDFGRHALTIVVRFWTGGDTANGLGRRQKPVRLHPTVPQSHIDCMGLVWLSRGERPRLSSVGQLICPKAHSYPHGQSANSLTAIFRLRIVGRISGAV
jgi:hypothetical protein